MFAAARTSGSLELINSEYEVVHKLDAKDLFDAETDLKIVGLACVQDKLIACTHQGSLALCMLSDYSVVKSKIPKAKDIEVFKHDLKNPTIFAFGGREQDLNIITINLDSGSCKLMFKAKNVKNDRLDLRQPIWISDLEFLPTESKNHYRIVTVTRYGQLRVYDTDKTQRPVVNSKVSDRPLCRVKRVADNIVIAADNHTSTFKYQINNSGTKLLGKYGAGTTGAVQALDAKQNVLVTGGLDRYLRVFNILSREIHGRIFIGSQITNVILLEVDVGQDKDGEQESDEEIWKDLENAGRKTKKRKTE